MKQNERLLVYAVTGFLALILVIAVLFGSEPVDAAKKQEKLSQGLDDILRPNDVDAELAKAKAAADAQAKALLQQLGQGSDPVGGKVGSEQPLIAKAQTASSFITMKLGESRRERFVRWVAVKPGDSFEKLVRRWCGSTQPYLSEAISLNEDTRTLIAGEQVMVPWVDDEVLAAIIEAEAPRTLVASPQNVGGAGDRILTPNASRDPGLPSPSVRGPSFEMPRGARPEEKGNSDRSSADRSNAEKDSSDGAGVTPIVATATVSHTVKSGDSLWRIAEVRYGARKANKMMAIIKDLNPGLTDKLSIGQVLRVPVKAE